MSVTEEAPLSRLVRAELEQAPSVDPGPLVDVIRERHGDSVAAVLFYGSCLRKSTLEGVLDFYVLVDGYRAAYKGLILPAVNALLPPNVFYLEVTAPDGATLRAKYAVVSGDDFETLTSVRARHPYFWARFAQPAALVHVRDDDARQLAVRCATNAVLTLVRRLLPFMPARGDAQRFSFAAFWQEAFRRTYGMELRPESGDTIRSVYDADAERYDRAARYALEELHREGWLAGLELVGRSAEVAISARRRTLMRWRWAWERPGAKLLAFARLIKNSTTFGDWVPYALWKLERHTGVTLELTERQQRHPFLFAWPVIFRVLKDRNLS